MAAIAGVLVSGIFDHYWFNMSYPHMTVLLWLHIGLGIAAVLVAHQLQDGPPDPAPATEGMTACRKTPPDRNVSASQSDGAVVPERRPRAVRLGS